MRGRWIKKQGHCVPVYLSELHSERGLVTCDSDGFQRLQAVFTFAEPLDGGEGGLTTVTRCGDRLTENAVVDFTCREHAFDAGLHVGVNLHVLVATERQLILEQPAVGIIANEDE